MSGNHTTRSVNGGYFTAPNRWFDAGYAKSLKPSVTIVFMFIRRWADVNNGMPSQPVKTISVQCGLTEKVVRESIKTLESIGVLRRMNNENQHTQSVWEVYDLAKKFEGAPVENRASRKRDPLKTAPLKTTPHYQPEYINNESNDSSSSDKSSDGGGESESPSEKPKRRSNLSPEEEAIFEVYCQENGVDKAANFGRVRKEVKAIIAEAGSDADEVRRCMKWMRRDPFWQGKAIQIISVQNKLDEFRANESAAKPPARREDYMQSEAHKASMKGWDDMLDNMIAQSNAERGDDDE